MNRKKTFANDLLLCLSLCIIGIAVFFCVRAEAGNTAVVYVDGTETARYSLKDENQFEISANGYTLAVEIQNGGVSVISADCPDRICKKSGRISHAGESIVCLPARIVIRITGESEADAYA